MGLHFTWVKKINTSSKLMKSDYSNYVLRGGGGGSGLSLWKNDFELGVGGEGQDTSRHFKRSLGPYVQDCQFEASEQKLGQNQNLN